MSRRGVLLFAAMCVIWGIPYLMIRVAVRELAPVTLVFLRTGIAALLLLPFALWRKELRALLPHWRALLLYTAIEVALPWFLLAKAETKLSSSLTGLLIAAVPLVGAVIAALTGERERQGTRRWLGLSVGIAGVAAIVGLDVGQVHVVPLLEIACVAVCYAIGPLIFARSLRGAPPLGVVVASLVLTAVVYAPLAAFRWPTSMPSAHVVESVLGLAIVCTALAFILFFALIGEVGPVRATVITYVNPAVAAVVGVLLLDEKLTTGMIVGFVLVLAGTVIATGRGEPVPSLGGSAQYGLCRRAAPRGPWRRPQSPPYARIRGLPASLPRTTRRTPTTSSITPNPPRCSGPSTRGSAWSRGLPRGRGIARRLAGQGRSPT